MNNRFRLLLAALAVTAAISYLKISGVMTGSDNYPAVGFCGGAREVGGSCYLVDTGKTRFLVDCGAFGSIGEDGLPSNPEDISFLLLTHAHSDHCGRLPELYAAGFRGKVFCTPPTAEIVPVMLEMSRNFKKERVAKEDYARALDGFEVVNFRERRRIQDLSFRFRRAGHLLGAAFIELSIIQPGDTVKIVFSGDLGSGNSVLIPPLGRCREADFVVMESTYGAVERDYGDDIPIERHRGFAEAVGNALRGGGDVLIPAFTLGRTQNVTAVIDRYIDKGVIPSGTIVYADSPTAERITSIYRDFPGQLSGWANSFYGDAILSKPGFRETGSSYSIGIHDRIHRPSIFVSSSGDLEHASSPRHLMKMFGDDKNLLCIVGWQPPGSLGRRLAEGEDRVLVSYWGSGKNRKEWISPLIRIKEFHCFSGHADQSGLLEWVEKIKGVRKVFLVHGEYDQSRVLADKISEKFGVEAYIPRLGENVVLSGN
ncbi:MAG TPA: MBL fold metallo-hydrolase [Candidatus Krumholzibacteriaceae bacterium]|nr:MBL fold metallo-hydrolase [Candidatus Krumholzibacteriaceae bacterium]